LSSKKKGYYIYFGAKDASPGVLKKIGYQIEALKAYYNIQLICPPNVDKKKSLSTFIYENLPFGTMKRDYEGLLSQAEGADFFYIRYKLVDRKLLSFYRKLKELYPNSKIVLEIPTYPYWKEKGNNLGMYKWYYRDRLYNKSLYKYIDRIATYSDDEYIYKIPTIKIKNGILVEDEFRDVISANNDSVINLLAVAMFQQAHGYERIIEGLAEYYKRNDIARKVLVHFVGAGGEEIEKYKTLVEKYSLGEYVVFHGKKFGEELIHMYDITDIGLGSFGMYKVGVAISSGLKIREYLAHGMPVVSGCYEDVFENNKDYYLSFENDSSVVDINRIISWYDELVSRNQSKKSMREAIHRFARENVDIRVLMNPVVNYINE